MLTRFCAALSLGLSFAVYIPLEAADIDYNTARLDRRIPAVRLVGSLVIDGVLNEPDWDRAPVAKGFIQRDPREGDPASEDTEVRVLYDTTNLYIGIFARDREPQGAITNDLSKDFDRLSGDAIEIVIDTFRDERNGYMFATNAKGAKWDAQMINEGREVNENWDALWTVQTRMAETGWYAEIAIPFRTLRFANADVQTWGVNFLRRIRRRNEESSWSPLPTIYQLTRVSMAGTLEGLEGVKPGNDLRLKPYILASSGKSASASVGNDVELGLDAKYGVTSGLTWDFTLNTEFSQVEADEQQVNLTRFSLFFPEKREFFLENSGVFQFGINDRPGGAVAAGGTPGRPNNPQQDVILFFSRRIGLSETGQPIPILGGTRLSGRASGYSIGVLSIQQRSVEATAATNFTALRLRRDVLGNSDIGVMVLNKDAAGSHFNRTIGSDANLRFFRDLNINGFAAKTFSPASSVAGGGDDAMGRIGFNYRGDFWHLQSSYLTIGERFNDEMGFLPRIGIQKVHSRIGVRLRPEKTSAWLREINPHWEFQHVWRMAGGTDSWYADYHVPFNLQDGTFVEFGLNPTMENPIVPFVINRRRGVVIAPGRYEFNEWFAAWRTNSSAPLSFVGRWGIGDFYDGYKQSYQFGGTLKVHHRLNASINLSRNQIKLITGQYTTDLITGRFDYAFSTQAFVNALLQYNTDAHEWSSNVRFNIIHRPLSDFFFVYNERRDSDRSALIERAIVAKMTYLMAF